MTTPVTLALAPSFGFGDRLGNGTPGHVAAMQRSGDGIAPIFAQQSIREMARTDRSPERVMADALRGMEAAGWSASSGADADHLKTAEDIARTAAAGFTFFTLDPSDHVDEHADGYDEATLRQKFGEVAGEVDWFDHYRDTEVTLESGTRLDFSETARMRCAVKYGRALHAVIELAGHVEREMESTGRDHELELSVDETEQPTSLVEHYILADQCREHGVRLVSLAPRFPGDFEKGVDFIGDMAELERALVNHAAIAATLGPYKLGLHSGSDKLSMYTALARATGGRFHVKTAGTSYLEALRVALRHDPSLFVRIVEFARAHYDEDRATYHVSAEVDAVPAPSQLPPHDLERTYLGRWDEVPAGKGFTQPGRQILHCTYGSVLMDADLGPALRDVLTAHAKTYDEVLAEHFGRHLDALRAGLA